MKHLSEIRLTIKNSFLAEHNLDKDLIKEIGFYAMEEMTIDNFNHGSITLGFESTKELLRFTQLFHSLDSTISKLSK